MNFNLPKIYAITDTRLSGLSHLEQVEKLIAGGITLIQLREKHASPRDFFEAAKPAVKFAQDHSVKIIINDRLDIALALNADGVHLGQDDLPPLFARKLLGPKFLIGFSTHSIEQAAAAFSLPVNYIAIGPIFATTTKDQPDPVVGLETVTSAKKAVGSKSLVAIGGINENTILDVLRAGADSGAVVGGLIAEPARITERAKSLISLVNEQS